MGKYYKKDQKKNSKIPKNLGIKETVKLKNFVQLMFVMTLFH